MSFLVHSLSTTSCKSTKDDFACVYSGRLIRLNWVLTDSVFWLTFIAVCGYRQSRSTWEFLSPRRELNNILKTTTTSTNWLRVLLPCFLMSTKTRMWWCNSYTVRRTPLPSFRVCNIFRFTLEFVMYSDTGNTISFSNTISVLMPNTFFSAKFPEISQNCILGYTVALCLK